MVRGWGRTSIPMETYRGVWYSRSVYVRVEWGLGEGVEILHGQKMCMIDLTQINC